MKALFFALGTRGDIEPFMTLALMLRESGWDVKCAFPEQFRELVQKINLPFLGLSEKFLELIEGELAKGIMGQKGSLIKRIRDLRILYKDSMEVQRIVARQQYEIIQQNHPDLVIYNGKCMYPMIWGLENPGKSIFVSPMPYLIHEVKTHASLGMGGNLGTWLNRLTYRFSNYFLFKTVSKNTKSVQEVMHSHQAIKEHMLHNVKTLYTISPSLFPRPDYWAPQIKVVGYFDRLQTQLWNPTEALLDFLNTYPKLLFVTFGSMTNTEPKSKTASIMEVVQKLEIPTIINVAGGGLQRPDGHANSLNGQVHFVDGIPYSWIFPKVYAVMHHGGSGTTHLAVKHGCVNFVIPHILDQFVWDDIITRQSLGPKGISIKKLNARNLEPKLLDLWNNQTFKEAAKLTGFQLQMEDLEEALIHEIIG